MKPLRDGSSENDDATEKREVWKKRAINLRVYSSMLVDRESFLLVSTSGTILTRVDNKPFSRLDIIYIGLIFI
ncbi:hypothetical protein [Bacteroides pyogenes]|uniref:hypothetical protein n=1 Tax=Bacteroides pyogenes TaxID=310300 RepID=UPI002FD9BB6E